MANIIQLRRDTEANWIANNPVLHDGEIGVAYACAELPAKKYKMGDGVTAWNDLEYFNDLSAYVDAATVAQEAAETYSVQAANSASSASTSATNASASAAAALAQKNLILNADFDFSASGTLTITYNANGTINTISDGTTTKTCGYNAAGQLTTLT